MTSLLITEIPTCQISAEDHSQRLEFNEEKMSELVSSISIDGLLEPLAVKMNGDGYVIVFGHRRFEALKRLGWENVPCIIKDGDEAKLRRQTFAENFFRDDLTPIELSVAIADEVKSERMTVEQVAYGFKRTTEWVRRQIAMCGWPADCIEAIHTGKISVAAAANLALITEDFYRKMLVDQACDNGATARTTAAWLQGFRSQLPPEQVMEMEPDENERTIQPLVPQTVCLACHVAYRMDEVNHLPICMHCARIISDAGQRATSLSHQSGPDD